MLPIIGGSWGCLRPEALPWLQAGASVVGWHPLHCRLHAPHSVVVVVVLLLLLLLRALPVTPPGLLRGRGQCQSEWQSSMSHCRQGSLELPLGQLSQPFKAFFNSLFSGQSCVLNMSSSVFCFETQKNLAVCKAPPTTITPKQCWETQRDEGAWRREMKPEVWLLLGSAREYSQSCRYTKMRWETEEDRRCKMCTARKFFDTAKLSQENSNLPC
jgi:hypothetical protein